MVKERIVWLDWAKVLGIMIVVFCHTPQSPSLVLRFFETMQMPLFFMLSGYLHKCQPTMRESVVKYLRTLFVPYLLFQVIHYPYYAVKAVVEGGGWNVVDNLLMPFLGTFASTAIDGPTWFLYALFLLKIVSDVAIRLGERVFLPLLVLATATASYVIWNDEVVNISFCIDSLMRFAPYFVLGYWLKRGGRRLVTLTDGHKSWSVLALLVLLAVNLSLRTVEASSYNAQFALLFVFALTGSFALIEFSKLLPKRELITELSTGTIIILGFHWMFIGVTNFVLERAMGIRDILYSLPVAFLIVALITAANYFIIRFCKKHFRILLGGR